MTAIATPEAAFDAAVQGAKVANIFLHKKAVFAESNGIIFMVAAWGGTHLLLQWYPEDEQFRRVKEISGLFYLMYLTAASTEGLRLEKIPD